MTLSVVLPTMGRPTLERTLGSLADQLRAGDEVLVVSDGHITSVYEACGRWNSLLGERPFRYLVCKTVAGGVGQEQRNFALDLAQGDYVSFIGDDDIYLPGALDSIRAAERECPGARFLFRWDSWQAGVLWREKAVRPGWIGDHAAVFPRAAGLARFGLHYEGDFDFIRDTLAMNPETPLVWRPEMIAICRPERYDEEPSRLAV